MAAALPKQQDGRQQRHSIQACTTNVKADVWAHFGFHCKPETNEEVDKTKVVCKHCHTVLKYCNITNLRNHLARHHADIMQQKQSSAAKPDDSKQTQLGKAFHCKFPSGSVCAQKITESVAVYIRPDSVVENVGFKYMVNTIEPRYAIPTRKHITDVAMPKLYMEVKTKVLESLMSAEKVALTCNGWTSRATDPYVTMTSHFISTDWVLVSNILQTRALFESHTKEQYC